MAPPGAGGCDFLADPNRRAADAPVFWRADELASVIVLTAAPAVTGTPSILLADLPGELIRRDAEDGAHLLLRDDAISHQLWLIDPPSGATPVVALIALDVTAPQRADATLRFWRHIAHGRPRTPPSPPHRIDRLIFALARARRSARRRQLPRHRRSALRPEPSHLRTVEDLVPPRHGHPPGAHRLRHDARRLPQPSRSAPAGLIRRRPRSASPRGVANSAPPNFTIPLRAFASPP